jgi:hypothetical protein
MMRSYFRCRVILRGPLLVLAAKEISRECSLEGMIVAIESLLFETELPYHLVDSIMKLAAALTGHYGFKLIRIKLHSFPIVKDKA